MVKRRKDLLMLTADNKKKSRKVNVSWFDDQSRKNY
jgi:hypothetical protein